MARITINRAWKRLKYIPILGYRREGFFIVDDELIQVDFREKRIVSADRAGFLLARWSGTDRIRRKAVFSPKPDITDCVFDIADGVSSIRLLQNQTNHYRFTVNHGEDLSGRFWLEQGIVNMDVEDKIRISISCRRGSPFFPCDPIIIEFDDPAMRTLCQVLGVLVLWMALDLMHDPGSHT